MSGVIRVILHHCVSLSLKKELTAALRTRTPACPPATGGPAVKAGSSTRNDVAVVVDGAAATKPPKEPKSSTSTSPIEIDIAPTPRLVGLLISSVPIPTPAVPTPTPAAAPNAFGALENPLPLLCSPLSCGSALWLGVGGARARVDGTLCCGPGGAGVDGAGALEREAARFDPERVERTRADTDRS